MANQNKKNTNTTIVWITQAGGHGCSTKVTPEYLDNDNWNWTQYEKDGWKKYDYDQTIPHMMQYELPALKEWNFPYIDLCMLHQ
jgi:hypothetical protein